VTSLQRCLFVTTSYRRLRTDLSQQYAARVADSLQTVGSDGVTPTTSAYTQVSRRSLAVDSLDYDCSQWNAEVVTPELIGLRSPRTTAETSRLAPECCRRRGWRQPRKRADVDYWRAYGDGAALETSSTDTVPPNSTCYFEGGSKYCDERVCMYVCLSVYMSVRSHISKTSVRTSRNFLHSLPVDDNAISYVLSV